MNVVEKIPDLVPIRNVLISLSDKSGLAEFVSGLLEHCPEVQMYSTGGTHRAIAEFLTTYKNGAFADRLHQVSEYTGQPEMQGGLVKTLDYRIYLGVLSEPYNGDHAADLKRTGSLYFDMLAVNLYPFEKQIARDGVTVEEARSHIDIGGPTMLRASAKNYIRVASVCNPDDYSTLISELASGNGALSLERRFALARTTFAHTAAYDAAISAYLNEKSSDDVTSAYGEITKEWA